MKKKKKKSGRGDDFQGCGTSEKAIRTQRTHMTLVAFTITRRSQKQVCLLACLHLARLDKTSRVFFFCAEGHCDTIVDYLTTLLHWLSLSGRSR